MALPRFLVIMPTFNGERYLEKQIDSILTQKDVDVRLVIRDDVSADQTVNILKNADSSIEIIYGQVNLGTTKSLKLLIQSRQPNEYLAFADQDDVWEPFHLSRALAEMQNYDNDLALLYFPIYRYIDESDQEIKVRERRKQVGLRNALVENPAIGCGIVLNPVAARIITEIPFSNRLNFDQQLYFVTAIKGQVIQGSTIGVNYRLHADNQIGIRKSSTAILRNSNLQSMISHFMDSQKELHSLFKALNLSKESEIFELLNRHFQSIQGTLLERCKNIYKPSFRREKMFDQLLIQLVFTLGKNRNPKNRKLWNENLRTR